MTRLDKIIDFVDEGERVGDIGSDHGITAIGIYEQKSPSYVLATDISEKSLEKTRKKIKENPDLQIETLVCDGIKELEDYKLTNIVISGMGGYLISRIIDQGIEVAKKAKKLILQANNSNDFLRAYLLENGFDIVDEALVFDQARYYEIIVSSYDGIKRSYDKNYYYQYGKILIDRKDPCLKDKLLGERTKARKLLAKLKDIDSPASRKRIRELEGEIKKIDEVVKCL